MIWSGETEGEPEHRNLKDEEPERVIGLVVNHDETGNHIRYGGDGAGEKTEEQHLFAQDQIPVLMLTLVAA